MSLSSNVHCSFRICVCIVDNGVCLFVRSVVCLVKMNEKLCFLANQRLIWYLLSFTRQNQILYHDKSILPSSGDVHVDRRCCLFLTKTSSFSWLPTQHSKPDGYPSDIRWIWSARSGWKYWQIGGKILKAVSVYYVGVCVRVCLSVCVWRVCVLRGCIIKVKCKKFDKSVEQKSKQNSWHTIACETKCREFSSVFTLYNSALINYLNGMEWLVVLPYILYERIVN